MASTGIAQSAAQFLKRLPAPGQLKDLARFVYRIPIYWRQDRSDRIRWKHRLPSGAIAVDEAIHIHLPDHALANSIFRRMAFERANAAELAEFLRIADGCSCFVDVGASGGFFSALFASAAAGRPCKILSIEPDKSAMRVLEQVRARNQQNDQEWRLDGRGIHSHAGSTMIASTGYGAEIADVVRQRSATDAGVKKYNYEEFQVDFDTFESICAQHDMTPDLVKIDIESFEAELFETSRSFIEAHRPRLALELHVAKLQERGKRPEAIASMLYELGYRIFPGKRDIATFVAQGNADGVVRGCLIHESDRFWSQPPRARK